MIDLCELLEGLIAGISIILTVIGFPLVSDAIASAICNIKIPFRKQE